MRGKQVFINGCYTIHSCNIILIQLTDKTTVTSRQITRRNIQLHQGNTFKYFLLRAVLNYAGWIFGN